MSPHPSGLRPANTVVRNGPVLESGQGLAFLAYPATAYRDLGGLPLTTHL